MAQWNMEKQRKAARGAESHRFENLTAAEAVASLRDIYVAAVKALQTDLQAYLTDRSKPSKAAREQGRYCYPRLIVVWKGVDEEDDDAPLHLRHPVVNRAFARFSRPGTYSSSITRPDLFGEEIRTQLELLQTDYNAEISVGVSDQEIPYPYVLDGAGLDLNSVSAFDLARHFPTTELALIGNEVADGMELLDAEGHRPLALFDGLRTDFSLARLKHYTG
ncbi:MAG: AMP nucleosidase, partial [Asticcacaulis sp.]|nr:AMP nucleosidase [Asticcacaulis sp.]